MIHVYYMHETLTPLNVRATADVLEAPVIGDEVHLYGAGRDGADADWRVTRRRWLSADSVEIYCVDAEG